MHDTPQQNGVAERVHGTILNAVRTNMVASDLPRWTWGESLSYVVFLYNRLPHAALKFLSPYEARFGEAPPDMNRIKPFGSRCAVRLENADKLSPRAEICRYLGPDPNSLGYRVYWPLQKKISVERNVNFNIPGEKYTPQDFSLDKSEENDEVNANPPAEPTPDDAPSDEEEAPAPRRSDRTRRITKKVQGIAFQVEQDCYEASGGQAMIEEPRDLKEALKLPDGDKWQEAADEEMQALMKRGTFEFTIPPGNAHIISSKFVFQLKKKADGTIDKYKARLVACGFTQVKGVDFYMDDTEAPVA